MACPHAVDGATLCPEAGVLSRRGIPGGRIPGASQAVAVFRSRHARAMGGRPARRRRAVGMRSHSAAVTAGGPSPCLPSVPCAASARVGRRGRACRAVAAAWSGGGSGVAGRASPCPYTPGVVHGAHRTGGVEVAGRGGRALGWWPGSASAAGAVSEGTGRRDTWARRGRTTHWSRPRQWQSVLQAHRPWRGGSPRALGARRAEQKPGKEGQ